jgi:molybdenum cofactor biosynthesis enzyme MoaA
MVDNIPVDSCKSSCWDIEHLGHESRRLLYHSNIRTHTELEASPEILNVILDSNCNLTCSYCDKQYSSAWFQDIKNNGPYFDDPKFKLTPLDLVTSSVSQKENYESDGVGVLCTEIALLSNNSKVIITGGEPFLYNKLIDVLNKLPKTATVTLYTGLGVNSRRLTQQLNLIKNFDNLEICVSAEGLNEFYEFNRHGNTYRNFLSNIEILKSYNLKIRFSAVVSNLTIFGLFDFVNYFGNNNIDYQFCDNPSYLRVNVIDPDSIDKLIPLVESSNISIKDLIIKNLQIPNTKEQQKQCSIFIKEFARRRTLSLDIFPVSMLQWLAI